MQLSRPTAEIFVPDGTPIIPACGRVTHLGIGAHPDDLEFMAFHGIAACIDHESEWFGGVTCGNGAGSARTGAYAGVSDVEMCGIRRSEQNRAAQLGRYGVMVQLDHASSCLKDSHDGRLRHDLMIILRATRPRVVYTHNLADKHDTHVSVAVAALEAVRSLAPDERPGNMYGCEMWRGLDWMLDQEKIGLDLSGRDDLAAMLNGVFRSQIVGGKRYDLGVNGRRRANATFLDAHAVDGASSVTFAMDLTPLVQDEKLDVVDYVDGFIARFQDDVRSRVKTCLDRGNEN